MDLRRNDGSEVQVHDRVVSEGHYGTVRFIGTLPDTKGKQILTSGSSMVWLVASMNCLWWGDSRADRSY